MLYRSCSFASQAPGILLDVVYLHPFELSLMYPLLATMYEMAADTLLYTVPRITQTASGQSSMVSARCYARMQRLVSE